MARIRNLWRFAGYVPGPTLMKVYRTAIEPILLYETEVIYEILSPIVQKRLLAVEYAAIRIAYKLDRNTTIAECLATHQGDSIVSRIQRRRTNFVIKMQTTQPSAIMNLSKLTRAGIYESEETTSINTALGTGKDHFTHTKT